MAGNRHAEHNCRNYDSAECHGCDVTLEEAVALELPCFEPVTADDEVTRETPDDGSAMLDEGSEDE